MSDVTDTTTETRALIARVRAAIAPADQPQALYDLARTADGEPRLDAGMLRREAASLEAGDDATLADYVRVAGSWGARRIAIPIDVAAVALGENDRLRARVAELEEQVKEAVVRLARVPDMFDRERREGVEAMRERVAKHLAERGSAIVAQSEEFRAKGKTKVADRLLAEARAVAAASGAVRALPLDDDAREPTFDFRAHLVRQREWSERTFGPGPRPAGLIDHIQKELREIEAAPDDLEEWIDVAILAFDGAWRAGYSPDEIIAQLVAKQSKNERREWPDWRVAEFGKAIEHVREDAQGQEVNER